MDPPIPLVARTAHDRVLDLLTSDGINARPTGAPPAPDGAKFRPPAEPTDSRGVWPADLSPKELSALRAAVLAAVRAEVRRPEDAEDLVSEALVRWCAQAEPVRCPKAWLTCVALRIDIAEWRRPMKKRPLADGWSPADLRVERDRERAELVEELKVAIRQLPHTWRQMVEMERDGLPRKVIAKRCRCSEGTVRSRLTAAYKRLRHRLGDRLPG